MAAEGVEAEFTTALFADTPRDLLAAIMALRPRRFHLIRANASIVHLRLSSATNAGVAQGLEVRMTPVAAGTRVSVSYVGATRAVLGSGFRTEFLADVDRSLTARSRLVLVPA